MSKILISVLLFFVSISVANAQQITFGIVPQQSAATLAKKWGPILSYLSEQTGHSFVFRTAKNIPEFEQRLLAGEYDVAYMNPYHYTVFNQKPGYEAFAKQKNKKIRGIIVVPKDSDIHNLEDLNGKTIAFPSPAAFAATVIPQSTFALMGIDIKPKYVSSHDSVYLNVARHILNAGGGIERTFNNTNPTIREKLRVLWRTPDYTPHAFATHPTLPVALREKIQQVFLTMNDSATGLALLKEINFGGIDEAKDSDWDDVRALKITLLDSLLEK